VYGLRMRLDTSYYDKGRKELSLLSILDRISAAVWSRKMRRLVWVVPTARSALWSNDDEASRVVGVQTEKMPEWLSFGQCMNAHTSCRKARSHFEPTSDEALGGFRPATVSWAGPEEQHAPGRTQLLPHVCLV